VQHVYGARDVVVVDVTNESPAPFVVALVVEGAARLAVEERVVVVDGRPALVTTRPPARWAADALGGTEGLVTSGQASSAPFPPRADRGARLVAAFLHPVAHRTTLRAAIALTRDGIVDPALDLATLPHADDAARGWTAQLERGMRIDVPERAVQDAVDAARADVLLAGQAWMPDLAVVAALEDWGFDAEAVGAWGRLPGRARRRLRRRRATAARWDDVAALVRRGGAPLLSALRGVLVREDPDGLALAPGWPSHWQGLPLDVRDAPTRRGPVSYSVRWHGDRPALLWEAPADARLTTPALDPAWLADVPVGEALLAAHEPH
jgi:hypothetical protein